MTEHQKAFVSKMGRAWRLRRADLLEYLAGFYMEQGKYELAEKRLLWVSMLRAM